MRNILVKPLFCMALFMVGCGDDDEAAAVGGRSVTAQLAYDETDSNHGPTDATGTAVVNGTTGQVDISVSGLPTLTNDLYEGWLAGGGETPISTGTFNTDAEGKGSSSITIANLSERSYTKVVLTVEPDPDPDPAPDARHSIQGLIPAGD